MQIAKQHPSQIKEQFIIYEKMIVPIFYLLEESQRQEIANRNLKLA